MLLKTILYYLDGFDASTIQFWFQKFLRHLKNYLNLGVNDHTNFAFQSNFFVPNFINYFAYLVMSFFQNYLNLF